jgi:hypothetical protein
MSGTPGGERDPRLAAGTGGDDIISGVIAFGVIPCALAARAEEEPFKATVVGRRQRESPRGCLANRRANDRCTLLVTRHPVLDSDTGFGFNPAMQSLSTDLRKVVHLCRYGGGVLWRVLAPTDNSVIHIIGRPSVLGSSIVIVVADVEVGRTRILSLTDARLG